MYANDPRLTCARDPAWSKVCLRFAALAVPRLADFEQLRLAPKVNNEIQTPERRLLDQHPAIRDLVGSLPGFLKWRDSLPRVVVDGETFWVLGGDQLKDHDQITVEWIRRFRPELLEGR
jgi:hypothetical protein